MVLTADLRRRIRRVLTAAPAGVVIALGAGAVVSTATATRAGAVSTTNNGDDARDGWYPDEPNLSPASITSGDFSTALTGAVYGQPLLDDGVLVVTTEADWIYGLDPVSGAILWSRPVGTAFNEGSQEGCGDLLLSGITATAVVDPSTGILYFTLSLSAPSPTPTAVTVRTLDGTATGAAGDYVPITSKVVTFAPGQTTATVAVTVNGKAATHSYFGLQMVAPFNGVTVEDDYGRANLLGPTDSAHEFVSVGPAGVMQTTADAQTAEVPVSASPHTDTITCTVNTADGTAEAGDGDYTAISNGTVSLAAGVTATTVAVTIPTATIALPPRNFTVTLSNCSTNVVAADPTGVVTIVG